MRKNKELDLNVMIGKRPAPPRAPQMPDDDQGDQGDE
jgi:serine protease DegQ